MSLTKLMDATGYAKKHRSTFMKRIVRKWPQHVVSHTPGKPGKRGWLCEIVFTKTGYKEVLAYYTNKKIPVTEHCLTKLMEATDRTNRNQIYHCILRKWPQHVVNHSLGKAGHWGWRCEIVFTKTGYKEVLAYYTNTKTPATEHCLTKLMEATGLTNRNQLYHKILRKFDQHVVRHSEGKRGTHGWQCEILLTETGYNEIMKYIRSCGEGWVYGFLAKGFTQDGSNWLKVGRAENIERRLKGYSGANAVRKLVGIFEVENMVKAEDHMCAGFREVFENCNREWFIVPQDRLPEAKKLFAKLFESL